MRRFPWAGAKLLAFVLASCSGSERASESRECLWDEQVVECLDGHCWLRCPDVPEVSP